MSAPNVTLLPFQKTIIEDIHDPATSDLVLLARGLGLRKILCALLEIYDSPESLVLLVNASQDEELGIGEQLGLMGCRNPGLRMVGYEFGTRKERQDLYKKGGLISVTSQILVVDMLQGDIPTEMITGIFVLHAEKVNALSLEAFLIRLYREKNTQGFLKAFSDQPEYITSGMSPLKAIMKELHLRKVHIYPRFHEDIKSSLERRKADVIELHQPMTEYMTDIHTAIVHCMTATLSELKRSNTTLDLDDFTIDNSYFKSFDGLVRKQLDPIWHKVGPKTKQLVGDLTTLRNLLNYLLTYDPLAFLSYLETILEANTTSKITGKARQNQSPWLYMDAANVIFTSAKRRCYVTIDPSKVVKEKEIEHEDEWDVLDEFDGGAKKKKPPSWLPPNIDPVLEELPKWELLSDVLLEIEREMLGRKLPASSPGTNTVLVMVSSSRTARDVKDYLSQLDNDLVDGGASSTKNTLRGRKMMESRLRDYLFWKAALAAEKEQDKGKEKEKCKGKEKEKDVGGGTSEALQLKDKKIAERNANRRRVRGGGVSAGFVGKGRTAAEEDAFEKEKERMGEAEGFRDFLSSQQPPPSTSTSSYPQATAEQVELLIEDLDVGSVLNTTSNEYDTHYGLVEPDQTVLVRTYGDDGDDLILDEVKPRFIVLFEPSFEFIRRIEVYRSSNPGLGVRVYFMLYHASCEEHKYLAGLRKEKESFERLIKERGSMVLPLYDTTARTETILKSISTRNAGGGNSAVVSNAPSQVIVDTREFRSTLPSLLHAAGILVVPATLTVGDYILSPEMCVERKSIPDLYGSFNSGRLYTQCELMCAHYKTPLLLIEFEESKSFSLEMAAETRAQITSKYITNDRWTKNPNAKNKNSASNDDQPSSAAIQSKLVLLALTFPRLRILWSSSPHGSAEIFRDLKALQYEPDLSKAVSIGTSDSVPDDSSSSVNTGAEELLRSFPGITAKNVRYVMRRVGSVKEFVKLERGKMEELLGVEPGGKCWEFVNQRR